MLPLPNACDRPCTTTARDAAALIIQRGGFLEIPCAGIVSGSAAALASALQVAASLEPLLCKLYCDCLGQPHEGLFRSCEGGTHDYEVHAKLLV